MAFRGLPWHSDLEAKATPPWSGALVPGPGPWSLAPGPGPWSLVPGPGPWSRALGPGPWSLALVPGPHKFPKVEIMKYVFPFDNNIKNLIINISKKLFFLMHFLVLIEILN